jgi:GR25 family glycosyltransferase involved in LPS biosynthesis
MSNNIDKIIYINLEKRKDRREQIEDELNKFNLSYERFEAIQTEGFGILGCGLSHIQVLKIAKERNYKNILIFEDDFTFIVSKEEFENNLINFFNLNIDYDVLFLSYNIEKYEELNNNLINKVIESRSASGYLVNSKYFDILINLLEGSMIKLKETKMHWIYANDMIWHQLQKKDNWFYFINRIGKQREGYSDNAGRVINYNC